MTPHARLMDTLREFGKDNPTLRRRLGEVANTLTVDEARRLLMLSTQHERAAVLSYVWRMSATTRAIEQAMRELEAVLQETMKAMRPFLPPPTDVSACNVVASAP